MLTLPNKYSTLLGLLLALLVGSFASCVSDTIELDTTDHVMTRTKFRINKLIPNGVDIESQVEQIRLLLFDANTGQCVINQLLEKDGSTDFSQYKNQELVESDWITIKPGVYEALLLANENSTISDLSEYRKALRGVRNKLDLQQNVFLKIPYIVGLGRHYMAPQGPFLMSAYLNNITIGSEKPHLIKSTLMASMTKIELIIKHATDKGSFIPTSKRINRISIRNIASYYSNPAQLDVGVSDDDLTTVHFPVTINEASYSKEQIASFDFYIPELIREEIEGEISIPTMLSVSGEGFDSTGFIFKDELSYFKTNLTDPERLRVFQTPLKSLRFEEPVTNNLIRNMIYRFTLRLTTSSKEFETSLEVLPWTVTESEGNFGPAKFKVDWQGGVADPKIAYQILTNGQNAVQFILDLEQPQGATWRVGHTNGLDFKLRAVARNEQDVMGATEGVVKKGMRYVFEVVPTKPFDQRPNGIPRYTEIYLVVDGKEEQLVTSLKNQNKPSGPGYRYRIKQIE